MPGGSAAASACAPARSVDSATAATDARRWGVVTTVLRHQRLLQAEALEDEVSTSARELVARITLLYDSAARLSNAGAPLLERSQAPPSAMPSAASQRQLVHLSNIKQVQPVVSCSFDRPTAYQIRLVPFCWGSHIMLKAFTTASEACAGSKQYFRCKDFTQKSGMPAWAPSLVLTSTQLAL